MLTNDPLVTRAASPRVDLVSLRRTPYVIWGIPVVAIIASRLVGASPPVLTVVWTAALAVMGTACIANAMRCGRVHCWFTGPFFLLIAMATLLHGTGLLYLGPRGWDWLGNSLAVGGPLLYFVPERVLGRYFPRRG